MASKARGLADLGNVYSDGALSNRNLIINGAMQVAQRGASATGRSSNGYYASDRFEMVIGSLGSWDISQDTDAPEGFSNSFKVATATAVSSPSASGLVFLSHKIEGQDLQHLKKGTANASPVTLSFWVKSNVIGTYQVNIRDQVNVRYVSASYTVNASGTWEHKAITFAGDTTGVLDNDNVESIKLEYWLASGGNFNSGSLNTSWAAANNINRNAASTVNLASATANYWQITGVQLEVGDTATPFEHRSYGDELQRCNRYWQSHSLADLPPNAANTAAMCIIVLPVAMRAAPSAVYTNGFAAGTQTKVSSTGFRTLSAGVHDTVVTLDAEL